MVTDIVLYSWQQVLVENYDGYLVEFTMRYHHDKGVYTTFKLEKFYHKGIIGDFKWSEEDCVYHGKLLDLPDRCLSLYHGNSLSECKAMFIEAVEDYLEESL